MNSDRRVKVAMITKQSTASAVLNTLPVALLPTAETNTASRGIGHGLGEQGKAMEEEEFNGEISCLFQGARPSSWLHNG